MPSVTELWLNFIEEYVERLIAVQLNMGGGFMALKPLHIVHDFNLDTVLASLVKSQNHSIVFHKGLPVMPHDAGYQLWSVSIEPEKIVITAVVPNSGKKVKIGKKARRFMSIFNQHENFEGLRRMNLPVEVRFVNERVT